MRGNRRLCSKYKLAAWSINRVINLRFKVQKQNPFFLLLTIFVSDVDGNCLLIKIQPVFFFVHCIAIRRDSYVLLNAWKGHRRMDVNVLAMCRINSRISVKMIISDSLLAPLTTNKKIWYMYNISVSIETDIHIIL